LESRIGPSEQALATGPLLAPGASQQLHRTAVEARVHAIAVVFDFVEPLVAFRRRVDQLC
jgi:hypothetical protein